MTRTRLHLHLAYALREARLFLLALVFLWHSRLVLALRGFGDPRRSSAPICTGPPAPAPFARRVARSIGRAARFTPGETCLTRAIAGRKLLALKGYGSNIRVGVRNAKDGGFEAHAWLISDGTVVLGGSAEELDGYSPIIGAT